MRKIPQETREFYKRQRYAQLHKQQRAAKRRQHPPRHSKEYEQKQAEYLFLKNQRDEFYKHFYRRRSYDKKPVTIKIDGELGIEEEHGITYFLQKANEIIDFKSTQLLINIDDCTRVWPSAITLLCSLMQWVNLSTREAERPKIGSSASKSDQVNSYLKHCGFYQYVRRSPDATKENYYSDKEIVKIRHETTPANIEEREDEILALLNQYSTLIPDEIEWFNSVLLTETFNNVTEHGVSKTDKGWWILAQYHKTHGIISLCIADNGVGIRNTLMTGPQAQTIEGRIKSTPKNDGEFIKMALEETVSGALHAPVKTAGIIRKIYERGSHRGNGLKRITDTCRQLNVPFAILSQHGYAFLDGNGKIKQNDSMSGRVFAGTLYHFSIPAKKEVA